MLDVATLGLSLPTQDTAIHRRNLLFLSDPWSFSQKTTESNLCPVSLIAKIRPAPECISIAISFPPNPRLGTWFCKHHLVSISESPSSRKSNFVSQNAFLKCRFSSLLQKIHFIYFSLSWIREIPACVRDLLPSPIRDIPQPRPHFPKFHPFPEIQLFHHPETSARRPMRRISRPAARSVQSKSISLIQTAKSPVPPP